MAVGVFSTTARYYDAFYDAAGKDYRKECAELVARIRSRCPDARTLLDVACGTGRHLEHLSRDFACVGLDRDREMLRMAALRCPDMRFVEADMVDFDVGEHFDVVTCLFSSIGYVREPAALMRAIGTMAAHVEPGGVLIVEPSFSPEKFVAGGVHGVFVDTDELLAVRMNTSSREDDVAVLDMHYLIGADGVISHARERHVLGLFTAEQYRRAFTGAGLDVEAEEHGLIGRGLLIGTRRG